MIPWLIVAAAVYAAGVAGWFVYFWRGREDKGHPAECVFVMVVFSLMWAFWIPVLGLVLLAEVLGRLVDRCRRK